MRIALCLITALTLCLALIPGCSPFPRTGIRFTREYKNSTLTNKTIGVYFRGVGALQSLNKADHFREGGFLVKSDIDSIPARIVAKLRGLSTFADVVLLQQPVTVDTMILLDNYPDIDFCIPRASTDLVLSIDSIAIYHRIIAQGVLTVKDIALDGRFIIWDTKARRLVAAGRINSETSNNALTLVLHKETWDIPGLMDLAISDAVESIVEDSPFERPSP